MWICLILIFDLMEATWRTCQNGVGAPTWVRSITSTTLSATACVPRIILPLLFGLNYKTSANGKAILIHAAIAVGP